MKFIIMSDIHGSLHHMKRMVEIIKKEKPDKIIILGDLYYHGPRNPLPEEYNPMEVANIVNSLKDNLIVIKGNCDAEVDQMISKFPFNDELLLKSNLVNNLDNNKNVNIFLSHGHKYNIDNLPNTEFDIMIYGHVHYGFIIQRDGKIFANPGSISLPKNNSQNSYILLEKNKIELRDLEDNIILSQIIDMK